MISNLVSSNLVSSNLASSYLASSNLANPTPQKMRFWIEQKRIKTSSVYFLFCFQPNLFEKKREFKLEEEEEISYLKF